MPALVDVHSMSWEELEAAGLCDCGRPLDGHPPLPKVRPWRGWTSERRLDANHQIGGRRAAAVQPTLFRHGRGRGIVIRAAHQR